MTHVFTNRNEFVVWLRKSEPDAPVAIPPAPSEKPLAHADWSAVAASPAWPAPLNEKAEMPTEAMIAAGEDAMLASRFDTTKERLTRCWHSMKAAAPPSEPSREVVLRKAIKVLRGQRRASDAARADGARALRCSGVEMRNLTDVADGVWWNMANRLLNDLEAELAEIGG